MTLTYKTFTVETKAVDEEQGIYEAMVSTESVDRDSDVLLAEGADISNYLKNPVVLFGHNYYSPEAVVARALDIAKIPGVGVKLVFQFLERGVSKTADLVHDLWKMRFLNAMSVGFIPKSWERRRDANGEELARGYLFTLWEFLEGSIVVIPANQDALRLAYADLESKGYSKEDLDEVFEAKRGRVLSAANEKRIRQAVAALQQVLDSLGAESEEDEDDGKGIYPDNLDELAEQDEPEGTVFLDLECGRCNKMFKITATLAKGIRDSEGFMRPLCEECSKWLFDLISSKYDGGDPDVDDGESNEDAEPDTHDTPDDGDTHDASDAELEALAGPLSELTNSLKELLR